MLPLVRDEVVTKNQWLTDTQFVDIVALSQVTPGPIGINSATYVGYTATGSILGATLATFAVSLPSFILVILISMAFARFQKNRWVNAAFWGIRPASVGLIASAALILTLRAQGLWLWITSGQIQEIVRVENFPDGISWIFFVIALIVSFKKWIHPILMIVIAGLLGWVIYYALPTYISL